MIGMGVDLACYALAVHFLDTVKRRVTETDRQEFAELLQRFCEDFVADCYDRDEEGTSE